MKSLRVGTGFLLLGIAIALLGSTLSPHDPFSVQKGQSASGPSLSHFLGVDHFGRDIFTRLCRATWISLGLGVVAVFLSALVGTAIGAFAGTFGGRLDSWLMRGIDLMMAFPRVLLAILIAAVLGPGIGPVVLAVGITGIPLFARQVRGSAKTIREMEFVEASRALGAGPFRRMIHHILPNALGPIIVLTTLGLGGAILDAAGLSFLGLGVEPDRPEWGAMLYQGRRDFSLSPWLAIFSGAAITMAVLSFNLFGDGLRDRLDPRHTSLRGTAPRRT